MRACGLVPLLPERADEEERDGLVSLPCSQSAHTQTVLARCAQSKGDQAAVRNGVEDEKMEGTVLASGKGASRRAWGGRVRRGRS